MDPFLEFTHKGKKYRTKVAKDAGQDPVWNETVTIMGIISHEDKVMIKCFDSDLIIDDLIGECAYTVKDLINPE